MCFIKRGLCDLLAAAVLAQLHQYLFGNGFESLEYAHAFIGNALEYRLAIARQFLLEFFERNYIGQVPFVELDDERDVFEFVTVLLQIAFKVVERFDVGIHSFALRIGDEYDTVNAFEYELAAGIVIDLTWDGVEVESGLESAHGSQIERQEVEEERSVGFGRKADQFAFGLCSGRIIYVLQVGSLAAESRPVIDDFAVDLARCVVDERQGCIPYRVPVSS